MNLLAALASVRIFPRKASHQTLTYPVGEKLLIRSTYWKNIHVRK